MRATIDQLGPSYDLHDFVRSDDGNVYQIVGERTGESGRDAVVHVLPADEEPTSEATISLWPGDDE
jgi:hypothetical protein